MRATKQKELMTIALTQLNWMKFSTPPSPYGEYKPTVCQDNMKEVKRLKLWKHLANFAAVVFAVVALKTKKLTDWANEQLISIHRNSHSKLMPEYPVYLCPLCPFFLPSVRLSMLHSLLMLYGLLASAKIVQLVECVCWSYGVLWMTSSVGRSTSDAIPHSAHHLTTPKKSML